MLSADTQKVAFQIFAIFRLHHFLLLFFQQLLPEEPLWPIIPDLIISRLNVTFSSVMASGLHLRHLINFKLIQNSR